MLMDYNLEKEYCEKNNLNVPSHTLTGIIEYVNTGTPTGDFLYRILTNDLIQAIFHADLHNEKAIVDIVKYCYWRIPHQCWGSKEEVEAWMEMFNNE